MSQASSRQISNRNYEIAYLISYLDYMKTRLRDFENALEELVECEKLLPFTNYKLDAVRISLDEGKVIPQSFVDRFFAILFRAYKDHMDKPSGKIIMAEFLETYDHIAKKYLIPTQLIEIINEFRINPTLELENQIIEMVQIVCIAYHNPINNINYYTSPSRLKEILQEQKKYLNKTIC